MFRNVVAIVGGIVTAFLTRWLIIALSNMIFPPPTGLDFSDVIAVEPYLATLPIGAFLLILASSVVAAFVGTLVACYVGTIGPFYCALIVGGMVLAATIANFIAIPYPLWLSIATLLGVIASAWLAMRLAPASSADLIDD
jgi:hypothetical protein